MEKLIGKNFKKSIAENNGLKRKLLVSFLLISCTLLGTGCAGKKNIETTVAETETVQEETAAPETIEETVPETEKETETELETEPEESEEETEEETEKETETEPETEYTKTVSDYAVGDYVDSEALEKLGKASFFRYNTISDRVFARMYGVSWKEGCPVPREELRYLYVLYNDFNGDVKVGELVCHESIAAPLLKSFYELFVNGYRMSSVVLVDNYGGSDEASSEDNNTSCFNYRTVAGSSSLSTHAYGRAIDINPVYNPYVIYGEEEVISCAPYNGEAYIDRSNTNRYTIDENSIVYEIFTANGFAWGGDWGNPDYMHFTTGG